jgi:hypothetical protein
MKSLRWVPLLLLLPASAASQSGPPDALSKVPTHLAMDKSIWQVTSGTQVTVRVSIQNAHNAPVTVPGDMRVEVRSSAFDKPIAAVIKAGTDGVDATFTAPAPQSATIEAAADKVASATCALIVTPKVARRVVVPKELSTPLRADPVIMGHGHPRPSADFPAVPEGTGTGLNPALPGVSAEDALRHVASGPPGVEPLPTASPPSAGPKNAAGRIKPVIVINPEKVSPDGKDRWTASMQLNLVDEAGGLVQADNDFPIQFTAQLGTLSPAAVTFKAGQFMSPLINVASSRRGSDELGARTPLGAADAKSISYDLPEPAALRVFVSPDVVTNAGGAAPVQVSVRLVSEGNVTTTFSDRDLTVKLVTTLGTFEHDTITISKDSSSATTSLTSVGDGVAKISATAPGFPDGEAEVKFSFPLLLAFFAGLGGIAGSFVARPKVFSTRSTVTGAAVTGLIVGVLFYAIASFQAFKNFNFELPIDISKILTGNELGALVLGGVGGILGRQFWKDKKGEKPTRSRPGGDHPGDLPSPSSSS